MVSRRRILLLGSLLGVATSLRSLFRSPRAAPEAEATDLALDRISRIVAHNDSSAVVGRRCLAALGGSLDTPALLAQFCAALGRPARWVADNDVRTLKRLTARRIAEDFSSLRLERVDGWILSRTEAKLYALLASAQDRPSTSRS
jgi:hypothetical protein